VAGVHMLTVSRRVDDAGLPCLSDSSWDDAQMSLPQRELGL
jgi:hypothetical protein